MTDLSTLTADDLRDLSEDDLARIADEFLTAKSEVRKENQILYYQAASEPAHRFHSSRAGTVGLGGGNRSSKTETCLVHEIALATGVFPVEYAQEFREQFRGPINVRICIESLTTVLHPIILPKLKWWVWTGIDSPGGERGHWGWVPRMCLKGGDWDKAWSEKLRLLTLVCRDPDNIDRVLGESQIQFMCLRGDQRIMRPNDEWSPVSMLKVGDLVSHPSGRPSMVVQTFQYDSSPLIRIKTKHGREIIATPQHRHFMASGSLKRTDQIKVGDIMNTAAVVSDHLGPHSVPLPDWYLGWAAIAIGDGCLRRADFGFTAVKPSRVLDDLPPLPPNCRLSQLPSSEKEWRIWTTRGRRDNPLVMKLKDDGLWGKKSVDKFVPARVLNQPRQQIAYFLRHIWNCDGSINERGRQAYYASSSRRLAYDVKYLLWSCGVMATICEFKTKIGGFTKCRAFHYHTIVSGGSFDRLLAVLGGKMFDQISVSPRGIAGQVVSIEKVADERVYCVEVDAEDHAMIVDGLVTHNSYDQDPTDFASGTFHIVHMDEPPPWAIWRENQARVLDVNGRIFLSMTWPGDPSIGVDWIYDEVYERGLPGPLKDPEVDWFELQTLDNRFIDPQVILSKTAAWSDETRKVKLLGQPLRFSNRIHPLFTDIEQHWCFTCGKNCVPDDGVCGCSRRSIDIAPYVHVQDFEVGDNWPCALLLDPHPRKPHMLLWVAIDPSDDYWAVAEAQVEGDAGDVKACTGDVEEAMGLDVRLRLMDPNMGRSPSGARREVTWQDEFDVAGLQMELADDSDVGRKRVNQWLKPDAATRRPRLVFHERCRVAATQMKRHVWDDYRRSADRDLKQQPKDKYSDYPALLKYLLNYEPTFRFLYAGAPVLKRPGKRVGAY